MSFRDMEGTRVTKAPSPGSGGEPKTQPKGMGNLGPVTSGKDTEKPTAGTFYPKEDTSQSAYDPDDREK